MWKSMSLFSFLTRNGTLNKMLPNKQIFPVSYFVLALEVMIFIFGSVCLLDPGISLV